MTKRSSGRNSLNADDRGLLDELVRTVGPRLLAYVVRIHGNRSEAEDIVAETFCRAATNVASLRVRDRPDLYLLTTARNLCRDRYRRRRPVSVPDERLQGLAGRAEKPADTLETNEQKDLVREAVDRLPEHLREVVVLRLSSGLRFEEIAEMLHVPLGTALSRMHTAIRKLKSSLGVRV